MRARESQQALDVVAAWQEAVSTHDLDGALRLSADEIEVGGPRGTARGHEHVRAWIARTGIVLEALRTFEQNGVVVVEQRATWTTGATPSTAVIGTVFRVEDGRVTSVVRHDSIEAALTAAGLAGGPR